MQLGFGGLSDCKRKTKICAREVLNCTVQRLFNDSQIILSSFLTYWAGLLKEGLKEQVIQLAEVVKSTALYFHKQDLQLRTQEERQLVPFAG